MYYSMFYRVLFVVDVAAAAAATAGGDLSGLAVTMGSQCLRESRKAELELGLDTSLTISKWSFNW